MRAVANTHTLEEELALARRMWRAGHYAEAMAVFASLPVSYPCEAAAYGPAIRARVSLGQLAEARELIKEGLSLASPPLDVVLLAAIDQGASGKLEALRRLVWQEPRLEIARIALRQLDRAALASLRPFPASPLEALYDDATSWLEQHSSVAPWVGFPIQVLERGMAAMRPQGLIVECGVYFGRSLRYLAARTDLPVHGFDSFEGLPEAWLDHPQGTYTTAGEMPEVPDHVALHKGWFEETLPRFAADHAGERIALLHLDCDLYSSTRTALNVLAPMIDADTIMVFDDFYGIPKWREHEYRALHEFAASRSARIEVQAAAVAAREVALRVHTP